MSPISVFLCLICLPSAQSAFALGWAQILKGFSNPVGIDGSITPQAHQPWASIFSDVKLTPFEGVDKLLSDARIQAKRECSGSFARVVAAAAHSYVEKSTSGKFKDEFTDFQGMTHDGVETYYNEIQTGPGQMFPYNEKPPFNKENEDCFPMNRHSKSFFSMSQDDAQIIETALRYTVKGKTETVSQRRFPFSSGSSSLFSAFMSSQEPPDSVAVDILEALSVDQFNVAIAMIQLMDFKGTLPNEFCHGIFGSKLSDLSFLGNSFPTVFWLLARWLLCTNENARLLEIAGLRDPRNPDFKVYLKRLEAEFTPTHKDSTERNDCATYVVDTIIHNIGLNPREASCTKSKLVYIKDEKCSLSSSSDYISKLDLKDAIKVKQFLSQINANERKKAAQRFLCLVEEFFPDWQQLRGVISRYKILPIYFDKFKRSGLQIMALDSFGDSLAQLEFVCGDLSEFRFLDNQDYGYLLSLWTFLNQLKKCGQIKDAGPTEPAETLEARTTGELERLQGEKTGVLPTACNVKIAHVIQKAIESIPPSQFASFSPSRYRSLVESDPSLHATCPDISHQVINYINIDSADLSRILSNLLEKSPTDRTAIANALSDQISIARHSRLFPYVAYRERYLAGKDIVSTDLGA
jgi:hypothetical protein